MRHTQAAKNPGGCMAAATFSLVLMASAALAQGPPSGMGMPGNNNPKVESREREVRESRLRSAELEPAAKNRDERRLELTIARAKEDFARIQILRNQIARRLVARIPLDYHLISDQAEEINKRANQLKIYMIPHSADEKEKEQKNQAAFDNADMTGALVRLCQLIDSFVENPAIKNAGLIDAKQLEKAKIDKVRADSDLLSIIELSGSIRKSAEKPNKTP